MILKIKSVFSVYTRRWFLNFFAALLWRKWKIKPWLASLKTLTNFKNPSSNPLQRACCGIQKSACYCKTCSVTRMWFSKLFRKPSVTCIFRPTFPLSNERWSRGENQPMTEELLVLLKFLLRLCFYSAVHQYPQYLRLLSFSPFNNILSEWKTRKLI